MSVYKADVEDVDTSFAIEKAMAEGAWEDEEEEEEEEEEVSVIPDLDELDAGVLSRCVGCCCVVWGYCVVWCMEVWMCVQSHATHGQPTLFYICSMEIYLIHTSAQHTHIHKHRQPHGTIYITAAAPLPLLSTRHARYLYHQAALVGITQEDLLRRALNGALQRAGVPPPPAADAEGPAETVPTEDGRALHQLPPLQPWNVHRSALLPTPVRTLYMDMLSKLLYVVLCVGVLGNTPLVGVLCSCGNDMGMKATT